MYIFFASYIIILINFCSVICIMYYKKKVFSRFFILVVFNGVIHFILTIIEMLNNNSNIHNIQFIFISCIRSLLAHIVILVFYRFVGFIYEYSIIKIKNMITRDLSIVLTAAISLLVGYIYYYYLDFYMIGRILTNIV